MTPAAAPWAAIGPGRFARPLGPSEKLSLPAVLAPGPRESHRIHAFADFSFPGERSIEEVYAAFIQAWKALRLFSSPEIACTYDAEDEMMHYKSPSGDEDMMEWQRQTFVLAEKGSTVEEVVIRLQQRLQPLPTCCLIPQGNQKATLLLLISHWRTEASGAFLIINRLFQYAADLLSEDSALQKSLTVARPGSEVYMLIPCLEDLMVSREDDGSRGRIEALFKEHSNHLPSIALPVAAAPGKVTPGNLVQHQRIYSADSSSSLAQICRSFEVSVSCLIHSAYVGVVYSTSTSEQQRRNYASIMPVQLRTRLPPDSPHRSKGCWNAAQLIFVSSPPGLNLLDRAKHLREQYRLADDLTWQHADLQEMSEQMLRHTTETPIQSGTEGMPFITSMGIVDSALSARHGALALETISVWADSLGPGIVLSLWSFLGHLNLQITWNRAFHSSEQVDSILDGLESTLHVESGIKLQIDEKRIRTY